MLRDIRHAIRVLLQAKGWTVVVLLSLSIGIGANTALFSAVNGLLLQEIPAKDPGGLVRLRWAGENEMLTGHAEYGYSEATVAGERVSATFPRHVFDELRSGNRTLSDLFACAPRLGSLSIVADGHADIATGLLASGSYFDVLGISPRLGRCFGAEDDRLTASPVMVISYPLWAGRFGLDPGVLGKVVRVNDIPVTIVGVLPEHYRGVRRPLDEAPEVHLPLAFEERLQRNSWDNPTSWWLQIMGRLKTGVTAEQVRGNLGGVFQAAARSGLDAYLAGLSDEDRSRPRNRDRTAVPQLLVDSGRHGIYDPDPSVVRQATLLAGVVGLLLLIVCANTANLLLARALTRRREITIRLAVGASRGRIVRQLATEGMVLGALGGSLGLLAGYASRRLLPFGQSTDMDWRVLVFATALSLGAGLLASVAPALRATRVNLVNAMSEGRSVARSRSLVSRALLLGQVALSFVLLVGAGLFLKTLDNLRTVDAGFNPGNVLMFRLEPQLNGYDEAASTALYDRITEDLRSIQGVRSVALAEAPFLSGWIWSSDVYLEGHEGEAPKGPEMMAVSPEFFQTMEMPILVGRGFQPGDDGDAPRVALVNETAARAWFGDDSPLGRRLGFDSEKAGEFEIVGVVGDVRKSDLRGVPPATVYQAHAQAAPGGRAFLIRSAGPPELLTPAVRELVRRIDPTLPMMSVSTQAEQIENRLSQERTAAFAYSLFGGLATLLAAIGLFGLASYDVTQRTREIGVRMALGAERRDVTRMVLAQSLALVGGGIVFGTALALAAGRLVASLLFGVQPWNGPTLVGAIAVMLSVASLASLLPARRASRVDPLDALRSE